MMLNRTIKLLPMTLLSLLCATEFSLQAMRLDEELAKETKRRRTAQAVEETEPVLAVSVLDLLTAAEVLDLLTAADQPVLRFLPTEDGRPVAVVGNPDLGQIETISLADFRRHVGFTCVKLHDLGKMRRFQNEREMPQQDHDDKSDATTPEDGAAPR